MAEAQIGNPQESLPSQGRASESTSSPRIEQMYQERRGEIRDIYSKVGSWHGTGRYQYDRANGEVKDVLSGIMDTGLVPSEDRWDSATGVVHTVSGTPSRMYARVYADMHRGPGEELAYENHPSGYWSRRFVASSVANSFKEKHEQEKRQERPVRVDGSKPSLPSPRRVFTGFAAWSQKVERKHTPWRILTARSDIPGNYPILFGIREGSFTPAPTAAYLAAHEHRSRDVIPTAEFTHVEVPVAHVEETRKLLESRGINLPILEMELGEKYSSEFSPYELMQGSTFREIDYPRPQELPTRELFSQYLPKTEWFTSPKREQSFYHGADHLMRVWVLQETLSRLLLESGKIQPGQIDQEALRWAAALHDIRRKGDILGGKHGKEGAEFAEQVMPATVSPKTREKIKQLISLHDETYDPNSSIATELAILKDADSLDRGRLEKHLPLATPRSMRRKFGLDPRFLHFDESHQIVPLANELFRVSTYNEVQRKEDPGKAVLDAATQMQLLTA
jgi:hypothetical protein